MSVYSSLPIFIFVVSTALAVEPSPRLAPSPMPASVPGPAPVPAPAPQVPQAATPQVTSASGSPVSAGTPPSNVITTRVGSSPAPTPPPMAYSSTVDYKKFRDPFKEPMISDSLIVKSDLERYAVTEFKVTGVITGPIRMRAMLLAPDGKTHYVAENMKLGTRDGVIVKITTKTVVVREKVVNPLGEVEMFDTEIGIDHLSGTQGYE